MLRRTRSAGRAAAVIVGLCTGGAVLPFNDSGRHFHKHRIGRDGVMVRSHASSTDPADPGFHQQVEPLLAMR